MKGVLLALSTVIVWAILNVVNRFCVLQYDVNIMVFTSFMIFATEVNAELRKDPKFYDKITGRIAAGRWGELDDLMGTMVFLASRASDYLNGVDINVDGGFFTVL